MLPLVFVEKSWIEWNNRLMPKFPEKYQRLEYARFTWRLASVYEVLLWVSFALLEIGSLFILEQALLTKDCVGQGANRVCTEYAGRVPSIVFGATSVVVTAIVMGGLILIARFASIKAADATMRAMSEDDEFEDT